MTEIGKIIAKYLGFPLRDKIKGTNILKTLTFLEESQNWDEDRINEYQLEKLKILIDYSKNNVPYYEELFNKIRLSSSDIKTHADINKIPILTKEIVREQGNNMVSRKFSDFKVKIGKTGGTTGVPVTVYKDSYNRTFTWASYYRWYEWMGINYFDPVASLWGARTVLSTSLKRQIISKFQQIVQNEIVLNTFEMSDENMLMYVNRIKKSKPVLLKGYLSAIILFAQFVEQKNYYFNSIKAISTTTESLLSHNREYISKIFGVPVFDQYGCGEVSAISYECSEHNGLHVNQEHVICEILDNSDLPIYNSSGRVVATDLDNYVMPFIRFENGDMATLSDKKCRCGINQPLMKSIEGRSIDTVVLKNGNKVHGVFFTDILYELNVFTSEFQRFQIYQDTAGEIEFRIESTGMVKHEIKEKIQKGFLRFLNKVIIIEMKTLPVAKSGKFSYIISNLL